MIILWHKRFTTTIITINTTLLTLSRIYVIYIKDSLYYSTRIYERKEIVMSTFYGKGNGGHSGGSGKGTNGGGTRGGTRGK